MKFAHIADTHIRNLKYHKEYREVFRQLYQKLAEENIDYIVHCGDIAHTKTQISPEFVEMCSDFFRNLADIAPTYIILGNHDGNLRNSGRQDALTPIVKALDHSNLYLLKDSGETELDEKFTINVLSVFDRDNWHVPTDTSRVNIAMYHGAVSGVKTDTGWTMENGEDDVSIFNNFDYGFLGDIHKTNQTLDKAGKVRYPGSTIQQNHGETNDKGFLIWDIEDKDTYTCDHHVLKNPKPFVTINLTPKGRLPNKLSVATGARLRLVSENNLPLDAVRRAIDIVKTRFEPEAVTYLSRSAGERGNVESIANSLFQEDLRDLGVQEELIDEYLVDYCPEDEALKKIYEMNKKYNSLAEQEEEVIRNVNWKLKKLEWDNLFNYGDSNVINFENLSGIVGILGKNFSGKSSIIDSFLYTLYNSTSKNSRKNLNLINQNEDACRGYVEIDIGTKTYKIERTSNKYKKKLKGKETFEAKTDVEFNVYDTITEEERSLNGTTRMETDYSIRKIFGTLDDFLLTSMASQLDSLSYLNEGSTKRKEILGKFLDLQFFDRKFKMCNEESVDLKGAIKRLSETDYEALIKESRTDLARAQTSLSVRERETLAVENKSSETTKRLETIDKEIEAVPKEVAAYRDSREKIKKCIQTIEDLSESNTKRSPVLEENISLLNKIENFLESFNINFFNEQKDYINEKQSEMSDILTRISSFEDREQLINKKLDLLKRAPCNLSLKEACHFVHDAKNSLKDYKHVEIELNQLRLSHETIDKKVFDMNPDKVTKYIQKYYMVLEKKSSLKESISNMELEIEKDKVKILQVKNMLEDLQKGQQLFEENKKSIESLQLLIDKQAAITEEKNNIDGELSNFRKKVLDLYKEVGSLEQKYAQFTEQKEEYLNLQDEYTTADLFLKCMHPNGISYDIIKKRLPLINTEISKILTNIVDFEIFFENEESKLDIMIKHPKHDPRPIEMGSGAEKTIAAMAIRLALLNVSTLPKGDIFVLDEPGTALDAENMEGFVRILEMIKSQFKTVLLISHLDSLKDIVDQEIMIEKNNGRAYVNE
jgi:DNA repair exonuclease SbcCD ATPase subunit/DNA repair exonuclease SbcCD nuclease subunit